jgi:hypothetical protein
VNIASHCVSKPELLAHRLAAANRRKSYKSRRDRKLDEIGYNAEHEAAKILKPEGEASRPNRRGYNLETTLKEMYDWKDDTYRLVLVRYTLIITAMILMR